jgi:transcriptional regulator with XRE-family HTH domain/quercetin dioxygenase-like cupin family protein
VNPAAVPPIGARIREQRTRRGVTLRALARDIGVSASLISQIETDKSQPSVSTLYAITTALGISVEDLFDTRESQAVRPAEEPAPAGLAEAAGGPASAVGPASAMGLAQAAGGPAGNSQAPGLAGHAQAPNGGAPPPGAVRVTGPDRRRRVGPVVEPAEREVLTLDSGVTWERLGQVPDAHVDFLLITYPPGSASSSSGLLMRHSGTEYGYVVSGELVLTLGFDDYRLRAGDAVSFDSTTPHGYRNDGAEPAVGVWFVQERAD